MKWWPFSKVEKRSEAGGYTSAVVEALLARAGGSAAVSTAESTAALETAAGIYARAFSVATVTPATATTAALTPAVLAGFARELIRRGECLSVIEVAGVGVRLLPAGSWAVYGAADPDTWWYLADLWGPSGNRTVRASAAGVVHPRYAVEPSRPWAGVGPLGWATSSARLHGAAEDALADESAGTRGHVLPMPAGPDSDGDSDSTDDPNAQLRQDIANLRGKTAMVETTSAGWSEGKQAAPMADWRPQRIGAAPPAPLVDLRAESARAVMAACGVPAALFEAGGDSAGRREALRILLRTALQPLADLVSSELASKLDTPDLRLHFDGLFASDLQGRARALGSMTKAGMPLEDAKRLAGLS